MAENDQERTEQGTSRKREQARQEGNFASSKEVSLATGLNESTVRVHLFRAIRRLRKLLSDEPGGTETPRVCH